MAKSTLRKMFRHSFTENDNGRRALKDSCWKGAGIKKKTILVDIGDSIYILKVNIKGYSSELLHIASFISLDISFRCWESTHYCWPRWKDLIGIWESLCFSYISASHIFLTISTSDIFLTFLHLIFLLQFLHQIFFLQFLHQIFFLQFLLLIREA